MKQLNNGFIKISYNKSNFFLIEIKSTSTLFLSNYGKKLKQKNIKLKLLKFNIMKMTAKSSDFEYPNVSVIKCNLFYGSYDLILIKKILKKNIKKSSNKVTPTDSYNYLKNQFKEYKLENNKRIEGSERELQLKNNGVSFCSLVNDYNCNLKFLEIFRIQRI